MKNLLKSLFTDNIKFRAFSPAELLFTLGFYTAVVVIVAAVLL